MTYGCSATVGADALATVILVYANVSTTVGAVIAGYMGGRSGVGATVDSARSAGVSSVAGVVDAVALDAVGLLIRADAHVAVLVEVSRTASASYAIGACRSRAGRT